MSRWKIFAAVRGIAAPYRTSDVIVQRDGAEQDGKSALAALVLARSAALYGESEPAKSTTRSARSAALAAAPPP